MDFTPKRTPLPMSMADSPASGAASDVSMRTQRPRRSSMMSSSYDASRSPMSTPRRTNTTSAMSTCHSTDAASAMNTYHSIVSYEAMNVLDDSDTNELNPPLHFPIEGTPAPDTAGWNPMVPISFEATMCLMNDVLDSGVLSAQDHFRNGDYETSEQQWYIVFSQAYYLNRSTIYFDAITNICQCIYKQGRVDRRDELDRWWNMQRVTARSFGGWSMEVQTSSQFADLLHEQGRLEDEEQVRREILKFLLNKVGQSHVATLKAQLSLGKVLCNQKKCIAAEHMLRSVLAHSVRALGPDAMGTFQAKNALAECLSYKDIPAPREAEKLWGEILFDLHKAGGYNGEAWQYVQARLSEYRATLGSIRATDV